MVRDTTAVGITKLRRVLHMVIFLMRGHRTVQEFATRFGITPRTVYRYLNLIDEMDFGLEQDFEKRFFIVDFDTCPLCGEQHKSRVDNRKTVIDYRYEQMQT